MSSSVISGIEPTAVGGTGSAPASAGALAGTRRTGAHAGGHGHRGGHVRGGRRRVRRGVGGLGRIGGGTARVVVGQLGLEDGDVGGREVGAGPGGVDAQPEALLQDG
ncbi:MAG: hypothetical protein R2746_01810 [Acidimicrobiales bacterium]